MCFRSMPTNKKGKIKNQDEQKWLSFDKIQHSIECITLSNRAMWYILFRGSEKYKTEQKTLLDNILCFCFLVFPLKD